MTMYGTNELVSSSEMSKKFGSYLSQIKNKRVDKLAVLKNNKIEAVLISKEDYELMQETLKTLEAQHILSSIKSGLEDVEKGKTKPIDTLWENL